MGHPNDAVALVAIFVLIAFIAGIPITILRLTRAADAKRSAAVSEWARERGMGPTTASAVPVDLQALYPSVVSFAWQGGVLSVLATRARGEVFSTFWWRVASPPAIGTAYASARRWGSGLGHVLPVVPTGDSAFDGAFDPRAEDAANVPRVFGSSLRSAMLACGDAIDTVSWDGLRWSVTQRTSEDGREAWERAVHVLEVAAGAA